MFALYNKKEFFRESVKTALCLCFLRWKLYNKKQGIIGNYFLKIAGFLAKLQEVRING